MKFGIYPKLALSLVIPQLAGAIGTIFTSSSIPTWYTTLNKPSFNPPNWIFGPVWTILFLLMGIALFLVWQKGIHKKEVKIAITIFGIQLVLNTLWSILFFGLQSPQYALVEIVFLWIAIVATIITFYKVSKCAAALLLPYILWVSFAAYLNYTLGMLN